MKTGIMAQSYLAVKILSGALKVSGRCSRSLHDVATKKSLHNADSVVGLVADSMGRSRGKLSVTDMERNGMARVGPNPDILQVHRTAAEAVAVGGVEAKSDSNNMVMTDPNSSMWNLCKDKKEAEGPAKKLTVKFKKMKENIKQYYLDRLEENQILFLEVNEPIKIGKLDKKDRSYRARANETREDEVETLEEMISPRPLRRQRLSLFSQISSKNDMDKKALEDESFAEVRLTPDSHQKGYRRFNKMDYKTTFKSPEDGRDGESRMHRAVKPTGKSGIVEQEGMRDDRMYMEQQEPRTLVPSLWKKPFQSPKPEKDSAKDSKEDCGFSEMVGGMSPAVHFKAPPRIPLRSGLLDSIKSGNLVMGFYKKRLHDSRDFSTLMKYNMRPLPKSTVTDMYDKFRPINLSLQREIATQCENTRSILNNNLVKAHSFSTCCKCNNSDQCRTLPPKMCDYETKLPRCPKPEKPPVPCCPKICLCGCDAPHPRSLIPNCAAGMFVAMLSLAKRPEYECPSFSECRRRTHLKAKKTSECCFPWKPCGSFPTDVGPDKSFVSAIERQEMNLGQKYWTGKQQKSAFHTSAALNSLGQKKHFFHTSTNFMEKEEECEKNKGPLPCLKSTDIPGGRKKEKKEGPASKGSCDKLCMPCCEPARDPPECFSVYTKPPCHKHKNPRPSFSECRKKFPFKHTMCECEVPKKPKCDQVKKKENSTC